MMNENTLRNIQETLGATSYDWDLSFFNKKGFMLDVYESEDPKEDAPSMANECGRLGDYTIHYALKDGLPLTSWFYAKINGNYRMFDVRNIDFFVPIGEREGTNQLELIIWALESHFKEYGDIEDCISSIAIPLETK